jgi:hypothetical protein
MEQSPARPILSYASPRHPAAGWATLVCVALAGYGCVALSVATLGVIGTVFAVRQHLPITAKTVLITLGLLSSGGAAFWVANFVSRSCRRPTPGG